MRLSNVTPGFLSDHINPTQAGRGIIGPRPFHNPRQIVALSCHRSNGTISAVAIHPERADRLREADIIKQGVTFSPDDVCCDFVGEAFGYRVHTGTGMSGLKPTQRQALEAEMSQIRSGARGKYAKTRFVRKDGPLETEVVDPSGRTLDFDVEEIGAIIGINPVNGEFLALKGNVLAAGEAKSSGIVRIGAWRPIFEGPLAIREISKLTIDREIRDRSLCLVTFEDDTSVLVAIEANGRSTPSDIFPEGMNVLGAVRYGGATHLFGYHRYDRNNVEALLYPMRAIKHEPQRRYFEAISEEIAAETPAI